MPRAAGQNFTPVRHGIGDMVPNLGHGGGVDQRPDLRPRLIARGDFQSPNLGCQLFGEDIVDFFMYENAVGADASLPGIAELADDRAINRAINVGGFENDERGIATQFQRNFFDCSRSLGHQDFPNLGRAGEGDFFDQRVRGQNPPERRGRLKRTSDNIQHTRRHSRLFRQLGEGEGRERRIFRRFDHDRAPRGKRRGNFARDHGAGKIPRRDGGDDTNRFARDDDARIGFMRGDGIAINTFRFLGIPFDEIGAVDDFATGFGQRLALFGG